MKNTKDCSLGGDQFRKSEKTLQSAFLLWRKVVFPKQIVIVGLIGNEKY
jgi:hypothetical protein